MKQQAKRPGPTELSGMYQRFIKQHPELHETQFRSLRRGGMDTFDAAWEVLLMNDAVEGFRASPTDAGAAEYEEIMGLTCRE